MKYLQLTSFLFIAVYTGIGSANAGIVFEAVDRGWWDGNGSHSSANKSTFTGHSSSGLDYNSFFVFDLAQLAGKVTSGEIKLQLRDYFGPDSFESFTIYEVQTPVSQLTSTNSGQIQIFEDLQSGSVYAQGIATPGLVGTVLAMELGSPAIAAINSSTSGIFAVGIHMDQLNLAAESEGLRWNANDGSFGTHQLELSVVPEPSAAAFIAVIVGSVFYRRRYLT